MDKTNRVMRAIAMWLIILAIGFMGIVWFFGGILMVCYPDNCPLAPWEIWFGVSFYSLPLGLCFAWLLNKIGFVADFNYFRRCLKCRVTPSRRKK